MADYDRRRSGRPRFNDSNSDDDDYPPRNGPRRKSILVSPNDGSRRPRRSNSKVRLQADSSGDDSDDSADRSRGARHSRRPRPKDLERKNSAQERQFRERRDGYLSDEGEALKKAKSHPKAPPNLMPPGPPFPPPPGMFPPGPGGLMPPPPPPPGHGDMDLPIRGGRPRATSDFRGPPPAYGDIDRKKGPYDSGSDSRRRGGRDRDRDRHRYDDYEDREPPRYGDDRRRSGAYPPPDYDRGYRSDHGDRRRRSDDRRRRDDRDDRDYNRRDKYGDRRGGYSSDRDDKFDRYDRRDRPDRSDRDRYDRYDDRKDKYGGGGRGRYDEYDRRDRDRYGQRGGKGRGPAWQREAQQLFVAYALPYIQKEGPKLAKEWFSKRSKSSGA